MAKQQVPVNIYREGDRLMVAAPLAGMEPGSVRVDVRGHVILPIGGDQSDDTIRMSKGGTTRPRRARHTGHVRPRT